jgi:TRAP-type C4-dicarboxylate transport system permease small subunit
MRQILHAIRAVNDVINFMVRTAGSLLVAFMVIIVFGGAITRYMTGIGYNMVMELPPMLMPWLIFPMAGILLRSGSHIAVDFLPERLSTTSARVLRGTVALIVIFAGVVFCYAGYEATSLFKMVGQRTEMEWSFPIWWIYLSFPVGFAIMTSFAIENLLIEISGDTDRLRPSSNVGHEGA